MESEVQKLTDQYTAKVEELLKAKEVEVMQV
jgi:ribosome recycling factor